MQDHGGSKELALNSILHPMAAPNRVSAWPSTSLSGAPHSGRGSTVSPRR